VDRLVAHRAQQELGHRAEAVRAHHDDVAMQRPRGLGDDARDMPDAHVLLAREAGLGEDRAHRREHLLGFVAPVAVEELVRDVARGEAREPGLDGQQMDLERFAPVRQLDDMADRGEGVVGAVDRHQCLEHGDLHPIVTTSTLAKGLATAHGCAVRTPGDVYYVP
jgi:hypothetical protein